MQIIVKKSQTTIFFSISQHLFQTLYDLKTTVLIHFFAPFCNFLRLEKVMNSLTHLVWFHNKHWKNTHQIFLVQIVTNFEILILIIQSLGLLNTSVRNSLCLVVHHYRKSSTAKLILKFPHLTHGLCEKLKNGQTGRLGRLDITFILVYSLFVIPSLLLSRRRGSLVECRVSNHHNLRVACSSHAGYPFYQYALLLTFRPERDLDDIRKMSK